METPRKNVLLRGLLFTASVLVLWMIFTWPLPRYLNTGISSSDLNMEKDHAREMIAGDHLQLLYHYWLVSDMLSFNTPFYKNLYEFNLNDNVPVKFDTYYMPFSLIFTPLHWIGGMAFAWNATGFIAILLMFLGTLLLVRRYTTNPWIALFAAMLGTAVPYRWVTLLTGSPSGFGMTMVPFLFLGLDILIRDNRWQGGLLAGIALLFSYFSDLHVVFFSILATPCWCLVAAIQRKPETWKDRPALLRIAVGLVLVAAFAGLSVYIGHMVSDGYAGTALEKGRTIKEVAQCSPVIRGLLNWKNMGVSNHIFLGSGLMLILLLGAAVHIPPIIRGDADQRRRALIFFLLLAGIAGVVNMAMGMNGLFGGKFIILCRDFIPNFKLIRQPAKIYTILPPLIAVMSVLVFTRLSEINIRKPRAGILLAALLAVLTIGEWQIKVSPTICVLRDKEPAYQAVAEADRAEGNKPRAVILPIWPGDSHWASLYEYYCSLYRIRMLNGYNPARNPEYMTNVFYRLESMNQGVATDEQLDFLLTNNIRHILFHEDAFPEQVSPFPAVMTLRRLLTHPRLEHVKQSESIHAFRILPEPRPGQQTAVQIGDSSFSTRGWEMENIFKNNGRIVSTPGASGDAIVLTSACEHTTASMAAAPGMNLLLRFKGRGAINCTLSDGSNTLTNVKLPLYGRDWTWMRIDFKPGLDYFPLKIQFAPLEGEVMLDNLFISTGATPNFPVVSSTIIPATSFYRAGFTDLSQNRAVFRKDTDPDRVILYAPLLPLEKGSYWIQMACKTSAPAGTDLGRFDILNSAGTTRLPPVIAGEPSSFLFEQPDNLPARLHWVFSRNADVSIGDIIISKLR